MGDDMSFKIYLGIIGALILACLALAGLNHSLKGKIEQLNKDLVFAKTQELIRSSNLDSCKVKIYLQNELIKNMEVKNIKEVEQKVVTKFEKIKEPINGECQNKVKFYEELINEMAR